MDTPEEHPLRPSKRLRAVVFDLDDTLVVSTVDFPKFKGLVIERIGAFGEDRSLYDPSETIVRIVDRFEARMRAEGVPEAQLRRMLAELDRIMDAVELERVNDTTAIPGAAETLSSLRNRGVKVGVLTRGCKAYAARAMSRTGISDLVDAIECRNSDTRPKPYPDSYLRLVAALGVDKEETLFVGDHVIDARCAANAGVPFIGVRTGDVPDQELLAAGAFIVADGVGDLMGPLARFLPG
jgi:phosphoglycolate phosphatase